MKNWMLILVFAIVGCAKEPDYKPTNGSRPEDDCAAYYECRVQTNMTYICIAGECACSGPLHEGNNTPVTCHSDEPDGFSDPWNNSAKAAQ